VPASDFLSDDLAENMLVERQIRDQALELRVLIAQLAQLTDLTRSQVRVLLLSNVERGLADAHRTTDIRDRRAALRLPEHVRDLLVRIPRALRRPRLLRRLAPCCGGLAKPL
jgi:hypothetical protein